MADHVVAVARELATRYPVDAVHVDYLRYESQDWGYHPQSLTRFRAAHDLPSSYRPPPEGDWRWDAWRREQTRTDYTNTRTWGDVFQAWPQWLDTGLVDAVFPMNYFRESTHAAWYDGCVAFEQRLAADCEAARPPCVLAVGQAAYLNTAQQSLGKLDQALRATNGAVIYSYQQSAAEGSPPLLPRLPPGLFAEPAGAPALR